MSVQVSRPRRLLALWTGGGRDVGNNGRSCNNSNNVSSPVGLPHGGVPVVGPPAAGAPVGGQQSSLVFDIDGHVGSSNAVVNAYSHACPQVTGALMGIIWSRLGRLEGQKPMGLFIVGHTWASTLLGGGDYWRPHCPWRHQLTRC